MPYKFNDARRHRFEKKQYRITNWPAYNESLRQRGDVTVWLSSEVEALWRAEGRKTRGGQPTYSDQRPLRHSKLFKIDRNILFQREA